MKKQGNNVLTTEYIKDGYNIESEETITNNLVIRVLELIDKTRREPNYIIELLEHIETKGDKKIYTTVKNISCNTTSIRNKNIASIKERVKADMQEYKHTEEIKAIANMYQTIVDNLKTLANTISTKGRIVTPEELETASSLLTAASTYQKVVDKLNRGKNLTEIKGEENKNE